jgi:cytosine/adenosine deaminase-related metal-dependent hydrolase
MVTSVFARWAYLEDGCWHPNVRVILHNGRIGHVEIRDNPDHGDRVCDALVPGLINSHCHLELTALDGHLPKGPVPFGDWLQAVINLRIEVLKNNGFGASTSDGLQRLIAGGTTTVINTVSVRSALEACEQAPIRIVQAWEVLGLSDEAGLAAFDHYLAVLPVESHPGWRSMIINPHAPYSLGPTLRALIHGETPAAWHLAESQDELDILRDNTGSIAEMLRTRELRMPFQPAAGKHPCLVLVEEDLARTCHLAFHLNSIPEGSAWREFYPEDLVAVHCPGTHLWFRRAPFPYQSLRENGVAVALGTDSLASNGSLSMLDTLRDARLTLPPMKEERLLAMVTKVPAASLPLQRLSEYCGPLGVIAPGAVADLVLLGTQSATPPLLGADDLRIECTIVGGLVAHASSNDSFREGF